MYTITKLLDGEHGKFECCGMLQDSVERWTEDTIEAAVDSLKAFASIMNATKLKRKEIKYLVETYKTVITCVETPLPKKIK